MMRRLSLLVVLGGVTLSPALADDASEFAEALSQAASGAILADAYMQACDRHDPQSAASRRDAMAAWSHRVDLPSYQRLLDGVAGRLPDLSDQLEQHRLKVQQAISDDVATDTAPCADLAATLDGDIYDIGSQVRSLLRSADDFGIALAEPAAAPISDEIEIVPLAMLSAQLSARMDEIGSKAGALADRDLREAREDHATAWLEQRSLLVIFGRVTDDDALREWRGDQQSTFRATCSSFADDSHEAAMAEGIGDDFIIAGELRWLRDDREGGTISLNDCRAFTHDPAETELAGIADDSAGLMLRPPEYAEAYAGPGQGIALDQVDRVLYDAEFENRMDGFGNGYTHRREDIYVLLDDGTAYRHAWNFAFTDLDVDLSRAREPDRWFTWQENGGAVSVTQTGGLDAGQTLALTKAQRLVPVPAGQRLDGTYYYLNVGMGGARSDRDYAFAPDGQLVHTRGGFVAGNVGTSYITVVGGDEDVATSAYAFDGHTMLIDGPDGEERHFVALFEGDDDGSPREIIIDGQVHWLREDEK